MKSTKEIAVSNKIHEQIIGQDKALEIIKKAAKQRRNVLLIGDPGTGKCVGKDTLIPTELGNIKARELYCLLSKESEKIFYRPDGVYIIPRKEIFLFSLNKEGKIVRSKIKKIFKSNNKKSCLKIKSRSGSEIILSGDHPILTSEKGNFVFKKSSLLKEGIPICSAKNLPINSNFQTQPLPTPILFSYKGVNGVSSINLSLPQNINKEIAYFIGVFVAEGDYSNGLKISNYNKKIKQEIKRIAIENLNYPEELIKTVEEGIIFRKSRTLVYILENYFNQKLWDYKKKKILGKQSRFKNIPSLIINSSEEIIRSFLAGYIDGDGHFDKEGFEVSSASKDLIENLRLVLLKLNILSRTSKKIKYASNTKYKKKSIYYYLTITGNENLRKLNKNLNLLVDYKKQKLEDLILKKGHTNVDLIYGVGGILKEIKNTIKINYKKYKTKNQTINRVIKGERKPSRAYIKNLIVNLKADLDSLQSRNILFSSYINYIELLDLKINTFNKDISSKKEIVSKKMIYLYKNNLSQPSLNTLCLLNQIPNKSIELNQNLIMVSELIPEIIKLPKCGNGNLLLNNTKKLISIYKETQSKLNINIKKLEDLIFRLNFIVNSDIFIDTIKKIEEVEEEVYDFEVEDNHNFITNGGLIVHNSLLGQALAELIPQEKLVDVLAIDNPADENTPIIRTVPKGEGKTIVTKARLQALTSFKKQSVFLFFLVIISLISPWLIRRQYGDIMAAAALIGSMIFLIAFIFFLNFNRRVKLSAKTPKLLIDNSETKKAPFLDASGAHAGALLGDVLHDPLQSFYPTTVVTTTIESKAKNLKHLQKLNLFNLLNPLFEKKKDNLIRKENYEAFFTDKNELFILGNKNNNIEETEILSSNRYKYKGNLIKLTTEKGKELIVTPEHKVAVRTFSNNIKYLKADQIRSWHRLITFE